jgi:hypothetical protein
MTCTHELSPNLIRVASNADLQALQEALISDLMEYLDPQKRPWRRALWRILLHLAVSRLCTLATAFDQTVAQVGFCQASAKWLPHLLPLPQTRGTEQIPVDGPLLILANHPGTFDMIALAAYLKRKDFKTIASDRSFFRALPATSTHLIFSSRVDLRAKANVIRQALQHLESGGMLVVFPAGRLEPDPAHQPTAALHSLSLWSESLRILISRVPETTIQVAMLSHLIDAKILSHPLVKKQDPTYNALVTAEALQLWAQMMFKKHPHISPQLHFGLPQPAQELLTGFSDPFVGIIFQATSLLRNLINAS